MQFLQLLGSLLSEGPQHDFDDDDFALEFARVMLSTFAIVESTCSLGFSKSPLSAPSSLNFLDFLRSSTAVKMSPTTALMAAYTDEGCPPCASKLPNSGRSCAQTHKRNASCDRSAAETPRLKLNK
eukprot:1192729-Prorocentrum_minimum.AAC.1